MGYFCHHQAFVYTHANKNFFVSQPITCKKSSQGSVMFSFLLLLLLQNKLFSPTLKLTNLILVGFQGHFACPYNSIYCKLNYNNIIDAFVYMLRKLNLFSCSKPFHNEYLCTALQIQQKKK